MKVCLVSPMPPPIGGISHWTEMVCKYAENHPGLEIDLLDIAPRWKEETGYSVMARVLGGSVQFVRDFLFLFFKLSKKPDILHINTSGSFAFFRDLFFVKLARLMKVPVVYHIHFGRINEIYGGNSYEKKLLLKIIKNVKKVIAIDQKTYESLSGNCPAPDIIKIPNFINLETIEDKPSLNSSVKHIIFVGWVKKEKGIEELLESWTSFLTPEEWVLDVVGPYTEEYRAYLESRFDCSRVLFHGRKNHIEAMEILASADVFVLPSYTEGFPNVVLEAMAYGKPIIATNVGAIPEMLAEDCGLIVRPQATKELLVAIETMIKDKEMREILGRNAKERASKEYFIDKVFCLYIKTWEEVSIA